MTDATQLSLDYLASRSNVSNRNNFTLHGQDTALSTQHEHFKKSFDGLLDAALEAGKSISFKSDSFAQPEMSTWHAHEKIPSNIYNNISANTAENITLTEHQNLGLGPSALYTTAVHSNKGLQANHVQYVYGLAGAFSAPYSAQLINPSEQASDVATLQQNSQALSKQSQTLQHAYEPQHVHVVKQTDGYVVYIRDASLQGDAMRSAWFSSTFKRIKNVLNAFLNGSKQPKLAANNDAALKSIWLNGKAMQSNEPVHHKHETGVFSK